MTSLQDRLLRRPRFFLERWVQRGVLHQLCLMASLIAAVAVLGGVAAWALTPSFESLPGAIWWSFLRLTDPGYLGDDEGAVLRVVSTVVTVLGYVLFMGSMIAIMTQWLALTIRKLESGLTPIAMENHFVILGWTNRTAETIKKLLTAGGRLERFFAQRQGSDKLRVVVLADEVSAERRLELRDSLGDDWNESQIFLRSGSSLQQEHLERLDLSNAAVVLIPGADFELGGAELTDARVVKTLLTLDALFAKRLGVARPTVVAELFDSRKVNIARNSFSTSTELVAGDRLISRILSQSLRHPDAAAVLLGLLTHREGNALYLRAFPEFVGCSQRDLVQAFPQALVLGVLSTDGGVPKVLLDAGRDSILQAGDRLILLAQRYDACQPEPVDRSKAPRPPTSQLPPAPQPERRQLLILGWGHMLPALLEELLEPGIGEVDVTIMSRVPVEERRRFLDHIGASEQLRLTHVEGDYTVERDLSELDLEHFHHVLFLASGRMQSSEEADARTLLGLLLIRSLLRGLESPPKVLIELLDPDNADFQSEATEVAFVRPRMLSHVLAHVGLLPELHVVYDALLCAGGAEIDLRPIGDLDLAGEGVTFAEIQLAAADRGCVGLGVRASLEPSLPRELHLNPDRERPWALGDEDRVVLLIQS